MEAVAADAVAVSGAAMTVSDGKIKTWPPVPDTPTMAWIAEYAVDVKPSRIPGAGRGVFAVVDIPAHRVLGYYRGRLLTAAEFDAAYGARQATYVLMVAKNKYVDASDPAHANWTAMINDARGSGARTNCVFTGGGTIKTKRRIAAGEELLVAYGADYWAGTSE